MSNTYLFTSESVSEGHPDKVADQISDAIVDEILRLDPAGRAAIETLVGPGFVTIAGEAFARVDDLLGHLQEAAPAIARKVVADIGYSGAASGLDVENAPIEVRIGAQSPQIRDKVERDDGQTGAGDQGLMFGYATDERPNLLPAALDLAHKLVARQAQVRRSGALPWLLPDAKSQVTVRYTDGRLDGVAAVVVSTQHRPMDLQQLRRDVVTHIIEPVVPAALRTAGWRLLVNPGGPFTVGGPAADCGLTGRKIIVDTYGGSCPHGGGAFSGKDPSKVDRSAAYAARWVASNVVAAGLARRCTVQLAYAIGHIQPISLLVDSHGTGICPDAALCEAVQRCFDLSPRGIIETLGLQALRYLPTAAYGHFGRDFPWDQTDMVATLRGTLGVGGAAGGTHG